jgi:hypothetical protein
MKYVATLSGGEGWQFNDLVQRRISVGANAFLYERKRWNVIEANAWKKRNPEKPRVS